MGAAAGGIAGGAGGFGVGAWFGDRFVQPAELQVGPVLLGLTVGASGGAALIIWLFLRGLGLATSRPTSVLFGACVPAILAAPQLWGRGIEWGELLGTLIGLTLLASVVSRAVAVRIARAGSAATLRGESVAVSLWALEILVLAVWLLGS